MPSSKPNNGIVRVQYDGILSVASRPAATENGGMDRGNESRRAGEPEGVRAPGSERKRALRTAIRAGRRTLSPDARDAASRDLCARLRELTEERGAQTVSAYLPTATEPDPRGFLAWAVASGRTVLLPIAEPDALLAWALADHGVADPERMRPGLAGTPEPWPTPASRMSLDRADLILVPAAAVDERGVRLGWGGGYFDRALEKMPQCPAVYAVVFDDEFVRTLPREPHDVPVDGVVTPSALHVLPAAH